MFAAILLLAGSMALAGPIDDKVDAAMKAEGRPAADVARDRNRRPLQTLKFFGLEDDMRVLELLPGGGWYTRILAPVLAENGTLYVALGTGRVAENIAPLPGFENLEVLETTDNTRRPEGERLYVMDEFEFGVSDLDMILTFRNVHNFAEQGLSLIHI